MNLLSQYRAQLHVNKIAAFHILYVITSCTSSQKLLLVPLGNVKLFPLIVCDRLCYTVIIRNISLGTRYLVRQIYVYLLPNEIFIHHFIQPVKKPCTRYWKLRISSNNFEQLISKQLYTLKALKNDQKWLFWDPKMSFLNVFGLFQNFIF